MSDDVFETPHSSRTNDSSVYKGVEMTLGNEESIKSQSNDMQPKRRDESDKKYVELAMMNYTLIRCGNEETDGSRSPEYALVTEATNSAGEEVSHDGTVFILNEPVEAEHAADVETSAYAGGDEAKPNEVYMEYEEELSETDNSTEPSLLAKVIHDEIPPPWYRYNSIVPRKRRSALPPPHVLLASPDFRLYLYSCRLCHFKCNAIKELSQHKKTHTGTKPTKTLKSKTEEDVRKTRSAKATELLQRIREGHHSIDANKKYGKRPNRDRDCEQSED